MVKQLSKQTLSDRDKVIGVKPSDIPESIRFCNNLWLRQLNRASVILAVIYSTIHFTVSLGDDDSSAVGEATCSPGNPPGSLGAALPAHKTTIVATHCKSAFAA